MLPIKCYMLVRNFFCDCCYVLCALLFFWAVAAFATMIAALSRCQSCLGGHNANLEAAESLGNVYLKTTPLPSSVLGAPGDALDMSSPQLWGAVLPPTVCLRQKPSGL